MINFRPVQRVPLAIALLFVALTFWFTYPQILVMDHAYPHQDPLFSSWRLAWIAHQLPRAPLQLFDANILHPARGSALYSDAAPLLGVLAAPLFWLGAPAVVAYNVMLLASFVTAAWGAFLLVRELTGSTMAGVVGGIVFAFCPFRFEHYWHLEIIWSCWIPLSLWALHRTLATGGWGYGLLTGLFIAAQALSCVYLAVFLAIWLALIGLLLIALRLLDLRSQALQALVAGAIVAGALVAPYAKAYVTSSRVVGTRSTAETRMYSAEPSRYLASPGSNRLYGEISAPWGDNEKRLFPGIAALALALAGLWPLSRVRVIYAIALLFAFDLSLGFHGLTYEPLRRALPVLEGLRVPARAATLVQLALAVLGGFAVARLMGSRRQHGLDVQKERAGAHHERGSSAAAAALAAGDATQPTRPDGAAAIGRASAVGASAPSPSRSWAGPAVAVAVTVLIVVEYTNRPMTLVPLPTRPSVLEQWLAGERDLVLLELPAPRVDGLPGEDPRYQFQSTFHWQRLVNGYSAFLPPRYGRLLQFLESFPDERSVGALRFRGVTHVIVHVDLYPQHQRGRFLESLIALPAFTFVGWFPDARGTAAVFRLAPAGA